MSNYPFIVPTAWYVLDKFLKDWQVRPYYWEKEIDTQTEITSRLNQIFTLTGDNIIVAKHHYAVEGFRKKQQWSKVNCEPCIE